MQHRVVGVDIAKSVMQVHWVDAGSGEIVNKPVKRVLFLEYFDNRPLSGRHGVLWWLPALGDAFDREGASGQTDGRPCRTRFARLPRLVATGCCVNIV
jgi:hypothetical protein